MELIKKDYVRTGNKEYMAISLNVVFQCLRVLALGREYRKICF